MGFVIRLLNKKESKNIRLILYRLDKDNLLIRDERNVSGISIGAHQEYIDAMSIKFYQYLEMSENSHALTIKNLELYKLYNRQVKLKLAGILRCAYRLKNLSLDSEGDIEIVTDRQTISIMKEVFTFLNYKDKSIQWKRSGSLTTCITINSLIMRFAALVKMLVSPSTLPKEYYIKDDISNAPTVLIAMPRRRPEDFFSTYVEEFGSQFNVVLYSHGSLQKIPDNYKSIKIKRKIGILKGLLNTKNLCFSSGSYIADILIIFKYHFNLNISIDVVNSLFSKKIDVLINRQQTNVLDNYLAIQAKRRGIFILGDVFEEIFYCDSAVCSSESQHTESLKLALANGAKVAYKGSNSLIKYRLKNFNSNQDGYLHNLLGIDNQKKIIFYASDPSKEESQRYLAEKFLIKYFSYLEEFIFVMKTHTQDDGKVTNYAFLDSGSPSNVILIGDIRQRGKIISKKFNLFEDFDFNAAISSSSGFLTTSSTSILQALVLGVKSGIVDKFNNGFYDYLVNYKATMLINSQESLKLFLETEKLEISDSILSYCGLKNENEHFDIREHILNCLGEFNKDNLTKRPISR